MIKLIHTASRLFFACSFLLCTTANAESLFNRSTYKSLISDKLGLEIGDKVTIVVRENTSAISSADTTTARDTNINAKLSYQEMPGSNDLSSKFGFGTNRNTSGKGQTGRAGKIQAEVTASIIAIEANGDIKIAGEKIVAVNDEHQLVRIEGVVRRNDISSENTIESNRLAQARITINGEGDLTNSQRQGWLTKILDWLRIF